MLKPLVKRGLFLALKRGFLPPKMGTLDFGGEFHPLGINLPPKHVFGCRERPASPYRLSWKVKLSSVKLSSGNQKEKKEKKARLSWTFHPHPQTTPLRTLFVLCMWGGVTDVITHAKFHLNRFTSFGSPGGRKSPFPTGLENGSYNSVTH